VPDAFYVLVEGEGPIVATAIHDGHALRDECHACIGLDEATRLREEDPYTARVAAVAPTRLIAMRSRFEVDLNRPRDAAIYRCAADAWGLEVWRDTPSDELVAASLADYDRFYATLERVLRERERRHGRFVVLDIHSYNHRRGGPDAPPADPDENPDINVGTGTVDRARWGALVHRFCTDLLAASGLDVRENVKFQGGWMSRWIHQTFPETGCALAIELKKTFMDEWTGEVDDARLDGLAGAIAATLPGLAESLRA
jgi:N-formylglutamate amidohydrolase